MISYSSEALNKNDEYITNINSSLKKIMSHFIGEENEVTITGEKKAVPVFPEDEKVIYLEPPHQRYDVNHVLQEHQHVLRSKHGQVVDTTLEPNGLIDVGKDTFNDIVLKAENIQDHIARFKVVGDNVSLTNYASSGTFLRHQSPAPGNTSPWMKLKRNQSFFLNHGDEIGFGITKPFYRFEHKPNTYLRY
jgi:hypothetical protein